MKVVDDKRYDPEKPEEFPWHETNRLEVVRIARDAKAWPNNPRGQAECQTGLKQALRIIAEAADVVAGGRRNLADYPEEFADTGEIEIFSDMDSWIEFPAVLIDKEIKSTLKEQGVEIETDKVINCRYANIIAKVRGGLFYLRADMMYSFPELEELLRTKGVPFDRKSPELYGFSTELVIFRPGENGSPPLDFCLPMINGEPFILVSDLREFISQGKKIEEISEYLKRLAPNFPELSDYVSGQRKRKLCLVHSNKRSTTANGKLKF